MILGEFGQDTMREVKLDGDNHVFKINRFLDCGAANVANSPFLFECDNPMDMQLGADGAFYLLTYGDGFFNINLDAGMYKWEYAKGQRAPKAVLSADKTNGAMPLTVNFSSAGSLDEDPGESIRYEWDFGDGSPISEEANPTHTYTKPGRFTAVAHRDRLVGQAHVDEHADHGRQHRADGRRQPPDRGRHVRLRRPDPVRGHGHRPGGRHRPVRGHHSRRSSSAMTRTATREQEKQGCSGFLQTDRRRRVPRRQRVRRHQRGLRRQGRPGRQQRRPPLTTVGETQIRQRKQQVEHVVTQSGTNTGANTDGGWRRASRQPRQQR